MNYIFAAAAAALMSAGAVQAATYQYDLTMNRTSLGFYNRVMAAGVDGTVPTEPIKGVLCENSDLGGYGCSGYADFSESRYGIEALEPYDDIVEVSLTLDTDFVEENDYTGERPVCSGPNFLCRYFTRTPNENLGLQNVTSAGFSLRPTDSAGGFSVEFDQSGFEYGGSGSFNFVLENILFDVQDGLYTSYKTTALAIAPVPLPASGLLLLAGIGGIAAFRRRASGHPY